MFWRKKEQFKVDGQEGNQRMPRESARLESFEEPVSRGERVRSAARIHPDDACKDAGQVMNRPSRGANLMSESWKNTDEITTNVLLHNLLRFLLQNRILRKLRILKTDFYYKITVVLQNL